MKHVRMIVALGVAGLVVALTFSGVAGEAPKAPAPGGEVRSGSASSATQLLVYKPPRVGAPVGRVGGGTRGHGDPLPVVLALAPDHTGLTTQEQPALYWYISAPTTHAIELTVIEEQAIRPLVETRLPSPAQAGVQRVRLAEYGIRLKPEVQYRWFLALIPDADNRSQDVVAGGIVQRIEPPAALPARLAQAGEVQAPFIYAEAGIWYDALAALSEQIAATPADTRLRQQRAALLKQVGLSEVAQYDLQTAQQ